MVINLSDKHSLLTNWISELRNIEVQQDRMRFRRNLERIGEVMAYEISKGMGFVEQGVQTPMGIANSKLLAEQPVLITILRAGVPLHQGLLNYFDKADNGFVSAYRKHKKDGNFDIHVEYVSTPSFEDRVVIISDPMLATGASLVKTIHYLKMLGTPKAIHVVTAIACIEGIEALMRQVPDITLWCGDIDEEITAKGYIVPGLGDAGDLAFGSKIQN